MQQTQYRTICPNCGRPFSGKFCPYCAQMAVQMPSQTPQQYPQVNYAQIAVTLLFIGAIILSMGVFALAFVPDEIEIVDADSTSDGISLGLEISGYKIGVILLAIGVLIEGIGSALATKEHFRRLENIRGRN